MDLLLCGEPIVISGRHVDCELGCAPAWGHSLGQSSHLLHIDLALQLFLVDVVNMKIGDGKHTLL